jgi:hypothetical protein
MTYNKSSLCKHSASLNGCSAFETSWGGSFGGNYESNLIHIKKGFGSGVYLYRGSTRGNWREGSFTEGTPNKVHVAILLSNVSERTFTLLPLLRKVIVSFIYSLRFRTTEFSV